MTFKQGMNGVQEGFNGLADALNASQSNRTAEAFMHLRYLMASIFVLGRSAVMSPKMKKIWLSEVQSERGKKSGTGKKTEAAETWHPHALDLAKEIRAEKPSISQQDLAAEIRTRWRLKIKRVSVARLVLFISKWERGGELEKAKQ
jgi:hypothetical protein